MCIIIGADCVPSESNEEAFSSGEINSVISNELANVFKEANYRIVNLEMPLTDANIKISKCGPALKASPKTINGYKSLQIDAVTLANNHIMDYGKEGLQETLDVLKANGIAFCGIGTCIEDARKPLIKAINGKTIGFYSCVEHEFSSAGENKWGANTFNEFETYKDIHKTKKITDYTVVLYHGGKEEYRMPSPQFQLRCRKMVDYGADLVICQHSHCIGCYELYKDKNIVYGQGNFIFDMCDNEYWNSGLLVRINDNLSIDFLPFLKKNHKIFLAKNKEKESLLAEFEKRSQYINVEANVEEAFADLVNKQIYSYMYKISGVERSIVFRLINKISGYRFGIYYIKRRYRKQGFLNVLNYIECESHREIVIKGLKSLIEEA